MEHPMIARLRQSAWRAWLPERLMELGLGLSLILFARWQFPPASSLFLLGTAVLAWIRLEIAIALVPLTLPYYLDIEPLLSHSGAKFSVGELAILICFAVALLRSVLIAADRQATLEWLRGLWQQARLFLVPAALLLVGASLALLAAPDLHNSLRAYRQDIAEPLLYFLLVLRYLRTRADVARLMVALVLSGLVVSSTAIIQGLQYLGTHAALITTVAGTTETYRPSGPYGSANNLALLLDRVIPIVLAIGLTHFLRRPATAEASPRPLWRDPLRWACVLALIPLAWALYWSRSRGAEVGIVAVVLFYFVVEVRQWIAIAAIFVVGAIGGFVFQSKLLKLLDTGHNGTATLTERFTYWKAGLLIIRDHFLLGTGPDSFRTQYNPDAPARPHSPSSYALKALDGQPFPKTYDPAISHPHNMLLDFWMSTGLLGLAALIWLLVAFATLVVRVYRRCASLVHGNLLQRLVLGLAGGMLAALVHGMVDNSYFLPDLSVLFWLFIASLLVLGGISQREQGAAQPVKPATPVDTSLAKDHVNS
jgi:putative inorganic carbon (HCO3(-)) transporter